MEAIMVWPLDHATLCHVELADETSRGYIERFAREALAQAISSPVFGLPADFESVYAASSPYSPVDDSKLTVR